MNWEAVGAIGEILGSLAVLATLIYVALQVSDARKTFFLQASQNLNDQFNQSLSLIASSPVLAQIVRKSEAGESLNADERVQLRAMYQTQWNAWENSYMHSKELAVYDPDDLANAVKSFLEIPEARSSWEYHKAYVTEEFRRYMTNLINDLPGT